MLGLTLTAAKRPLVAETRRKNARTVVLDGIAHQIAFLENNSYTVTRTRYSRDADGGYCRKPIAAAPKRWDWIDSAGQRFLQIRYGSSVVIELEAGKPTIVVPGGADADVIAVLAKVAKAVEVGKLDGQIEIARQKTRRAKAQG